MIDFYSERGSKKGKSDAQAKREKLTSTMKRNFKAVLDNICENTQCKNKIYEIHHIVGVKKGSNTPSNLIGLCANCHRDAHSGDITKANLKKIVSKRHSKKKELLRAILKGANVKKSRSGGLSLESAFPVGTLDLSIKKSKGKKTKKPKSRFDIF